MASAGSSFRSPMPNSPTRPAGQEPSADPQSLMGDSGSTPSQPSGQSSTEADANRQFVNLLRTIHDQIDTLSRMRPEFSPFGRRAKQALTDGMVKAVAGQREGAASGSQPSPE